ncbi:hypothetical protein ACSU1N_02675 [Thermogladius sp. 4427co]|uniref:hypothetical protein n=1 Tax=Thermogladius sp. 4427co TaxID=3450718 RepID=UPI003F7ADF19
MGKRRKKYKRIIKRIPRIPTVFQCPRCGAKTLSIKFEKTDTPGLKKAIISCGNCGLYAEYPQPVPELLQPVDIYAKFIDLYLEGKIKIEERKPEEVKEIGEGSELPEGEA